MAVIKFTNSKSNIKRIIDYVTQECKTTTKLITGKDCMAGNSYQEMLATKNMYHKTDGRQYIHLVQSFAITDKLTKEQAHEIGIKLAEYFTGFQVFVATHIDREHLHNHLILNSVNFENGKKFHQSKQEMQEVKDYSDKLCEEYGASVIKEKEYKGIYKQSEYQVALKGESQKIRLTNAIDYSLSKSNSKMEFIKVMNNLSYQVKWYDNYKYITYTTPDGSKFRDNKLNSPKYLKGEMENAFNGRNKENESNTNTKSAEITNTDTNRDEIQFGTGRTAIYNPRLDKTNIAEYSRHQIKNARPQDISGYGDRTKKGDDQYSGKSNKGEFKQIGNYSGTREKEKYDIQSQSSRNIYTCNDSSMRNIISTVRDVGGILELFAVKEQQPKRKIGGWKRDLSKQAKKEWYLKHRTGTSMWQSQEDEWEM